MGNSNNVLSWLLGVIVLGGALILSIYVFAFLLPFVLVLILATILLNFGRYCYFKYKIMQNTAEIINPEKGKKDNNKNKVIDVEYEIVDDGKNSNK